MRQGTTLGNRDVWLKIILLANKWAWQQTPMLLSLILQNPAVRTSGTAEMLLLAIGIKKLTMGTLPREQEWMVIVCRPKSSGWGKYRGKGKVVGEGAKWALGPDHSVGW